MTRCRWVRTRSVGGGRLVALPRRKRVCGVRRGEGECGDQREERPGDRCVLSGRLRRDAGDEDGRHQRLLAAPTSDLGVAIRFMPALAATRLRGRRGGGAGTTIAATAATLGSEAEAKELDVPVGAAATAIRQPGGQDRDRREPDGADPNGGIEEAHTKILAYSAGAVNAGRVTGASLLGSYPQVFTEGIRCGALTPLWGLSRWGPPALRIASLSALSAAWAASLYCRRTTSTSAR